MLCDQAATGTLPGGEDVSLFPRREVAAFAEARLTD
jgi:hypothetical protein